MKSNTSVTNCEIKIFRYTISSRQNPLLVTLKDTLTNGKKGM